MNLGDFNTEQEAAYAFNVGEVLVNFTSNLNELNCGLALTSEQKQKVEDCVAKSVRDFLNLPTDFKFPSKAREILDRTVRVI